MIRFDNFRPLGDEETIAMCLAWAGSQGVWLEVESDAARTLAMRCSGCDRLYSFVYLTRQLAESAAGKPKLCKSCRGNLGESS